MLDENGDMIPATADDLEKIRFDPDELEPYVFGDGAGGSVEPQEDRSRTPPGGRTFLPLPIF
jgi:hypothetical protein